jgi:hypothetical protein
MSDVVFSITQPIVSITPPDPIVCEITVDQPEVRIEVG